MRWWRMGKRRGRGLGGWGRRQHAESFTTLNTSLLNGYGLFQLDNHFKQGHHTYMT